MTETARKLLDTFDALPEPERQEVAREILWRTALAEHGPLEDADLVALATSRCNGPGGSHCSPPGR